MKITLSNPTRSRKWGWAYSTVPTGKGAYSIETPAAPMYVGTARTVMNRIRKDREFNNLGGAFYTTAWFYDNKRIVNHVDAALFMDDLYNYDTFPGAPKPPASITLYLAEEEAV